MRARGDFTADQRLILISAIALIIGAICAVVAVVLLKLIGFFTNLFFYQHLSFAFISPAKNHLGAGVILVPVVGGLIVGLMARYGSDRIRGHGIPVALEGAVAAATRRYFLGPGPLFPVPPHSPVGPLALLACVGVGLGAGIASALLTWGVYAAEDAFHRLPIHWMWWPVLGGVVVG